MKKIYISDLTKLGIIEERPKGPIKFHPNTLISEIALDFKKKKYWVGSNSGSRR